MEAMRAVLSEVLGKEAAAEVDEGDLLALHKGGYRNKRKIQLATRDGLKDAGVKLALIDELLGALADAGAEAATAAAQVGQAGGVTAPQGPSSAWGRLQLLMQQYPLSRLEGFASTMERNLAARRGRIKANSEGLVEYVGRYFPLVGIRHSVDQLIEVLSRLHRSSTRDLWEFFLEGLQLLRVVGAPGTGKSTLLRCIWGLLLDRIKEVRATDKELWKQWEVWQVDQLEARIRAWGGRPWVFLLSLERSALHRLTAVEQTLRPANCLALRMLFGVVGELYDSRYDYFVQQLNSHEPELLDLQPLEVMQYVEAVYGSSSGSSSHAASSSTTGKQPSMAVWAFDEVNVVPDDPDQPTWFQLQLSEAVKARESALLSSECNMMPIFITAGTRGSAVSLLKTASRKSRIKDIRLATFSGLQEQQLMVMDVIRRLPWPAAANKPRPQWLPNQEQSLSSLQEQEKQQLLQRCPAVLTELLHWCGNLFRAVEYAFAGCGGIKDDKHFRIKRLPSLMKEKGLLEETDSILKDVSEILARSGDWQKYCHASDRNHRLMVQVFAYSITWKPVSRSTELMPADERLNAIRVQDLEVDGMVLLVPRKTMQGSEDSEDGRVAGQTGDVAPDDVADLAITLPPVVMVMLQTKLEALPHAFQGWASLPLLQTLDDFWPNREITDVVTMALRLRLYREVFRQETVALRDLHHGFSGGQCDVTVLIPTDGYKPTPPPEGHMTASKFEDTVRSATADDNWLYVGSSNSGPGDSWVVLFRADASSSNASTSNASTRNEPPWRVVISIQSKQRSFEDRVSSTALMQEVDKVPMLQLKNCMQAFLYVADQLPGKGLQHLNEQDVNMQPAPRHSSLLATALLPHFRWQPRKRAGAVLRDGKEMSVVLVLGDEEHLLRGATTVVKHALKRRRA